MLLVLGSLLFADDLPERVLGAATGLFVVGLLKMTSELAVTSRRLKEETRVSSDSIDTMKQELTQFRVMLSDSETNLTREAERLEASIGALADRVSSLRVGLAAALDGLKDAEDRTQRKVEGLRAEIDARLTTHAEALRDLTEALRPVRRHKLHEAIHIRELALGESLDALSKGKQGPDGNQVRSPE